MPVIDTKHLTFADYLNLPTIMQRYDIVNGEMVMSAAPTGRHQAIIGNIYVVVRAYLRDNQRGIIIFAPCDIIICRDPLRTRQPDLFIFLHGREDAADLENQLDQPMIERAPDATIEIISRHDTRRSLVDKVEDYRLIGVKECWLVSPQAQTVEVLGLSSGGVRTVGIYGVGMRVHSEVLDGLALAIDDIFA